MRKSAILLLLLAALIFPSQALKAQPTTGPNSRMSVQSDFISKYYWRGMEKGGFSIQPSATFNYHGLYARLFASTGLDKDDADEINISLGYKAPFGLKIGVNDYWTSDVEENNRYFFYEDKKTAHQFEGNIGFESKYFSLNAYTMFWGNDYKIDGDRAYSTYIELKVPFRLWNVNWDAVAGFTPMESAGWDEVDPYAYFEIHHKTYYYADTFSCVLAGLRATKNMRYKNMNIPIFVEFDTNPYLRTAAVVAGVSLKPF